jgi:hypothetical protein
MKAVFLAVTNDEPIPALEKLGVNFDISLESDIAAERQAKEAEKERMDIDDGAIDNATSAGPDVSARVRNSVMKLCLSNRLNIPCRLMN